MVEMDRTDNLAEMQWLLCSLFFLLGIHRFSTRTGDDAAWHADIEFATSLLSTSVRVQLVD
jgi:hypothetical protein